MISRLTGVILERSPPQLVIDVRGVGYEVQMPLSAFAELPDAGEVVLYTQLVVREDAHLLYGFPNPARRAWFRLLLRVNGIGPRVALAILSTLSDGELADALGHEDVGRLVRVPGVGRKTAERLLVELRGQAPVSPGIPVRAADEAASALAVLGYKPNETKIAIERALAALGREAASEDLIRAALQGMAR
ncbi:MAG: Holliday junction branch migration protein RuvA [Gammaproteobacteria bacterium]|nr:Holliday junction branch migration protein RuvA [Gammaproteobacteria bacterium]